MRHGLAFRARWSALALVGTVCWSGCQLHEGEVDEASHTFEREAEVVYDSERFRDSLTLNEEHAILLGFEQEELVTGALDHVTSRLRDGVIGEVEHVEVFERFGLVSVKVRGEVDLAALEQISGLARVHEDLQLRRHTTAANAFIEQPFAVQEGHLGAGVSVVVLDTGVDWSHQDFGSCTAAGAPGCRVVHEQDFAVDDGLSDDHGHGTNVAGIVARVAPASEIVALDVFDGDVANSSSIIAALNWVITHRTTHDIGVVNMSLGGGHFDVACSSTVFAPVMQSLRQHGIVAVGSAGNDGYVGGIAAPACDPLVMSVGAVYDRSIGGAIYASCADATSAADQVACFSNTASFLDVLAPGVSMSAGGWTMSGTSQAAPVVSAAMAILKSAYPQESVPERIARLKRSGGVVDARSGDSFVRVDFSKVFDVVVPCQYTYSPVSGLTHEATEGVIEIDVTTDPHCTWNAQSSEPWAFVDSSQRTGSGRVEVMLDANVQTVDRQVDVTLAGMSVTLTQLGELPPPVVPDEIDVVGWLSMNWWRETTRDRRVVVMLGADTPTGSAITEMCVQVRERGEPEQSCTAWSSFHTFGLIALPDRDADYLTKVWLRDEFGSTSRVPLVAPITLDRQAPVDGSASLMQSSGGWDVMVGDASDEGSGISHYKVFARRGVAPTSCFELPWNTLVYQGREAGQVSVPWSDHTQDVFFRVCAYDRAGNMSRGVVISTQDVHGF